MGYLYYWLNCIANRKFKESNELKEKVKEIIILDRTSR